MADTADAVAAGSSVEATDGTRQLTEHGRERKQQLLDAALESFSSRGYSATRIADICRSAGVAKGLFYWYFDTKDDLFADLVRTMRRELRRAQAAAMDPGVDARERIAQGAEASVHFMADHAAWFTLLDDERTVADVGEVVREGARVHLDDVRGLVEEGQRDGVIPDADPDLVAVGVLGAVSTFSNWIRSGSRGDRSVDEVASFARTWVRKALS